MNHLYRTTEEALMLVKDGDRVFIHGGAATPMALVDALLARAGEIKNVELVSISTYGAFDWKRPLVRESFYLNSLFVSPNVREWVNSEAGDYVPVFLSEIARLFESGMLPLDVALVQVSPPDGNGFCTLGTSVDATLSAVRSAKTVIAQVNPLMPRVMGDGVVHVSAFAEMVLCEAPLPEVCYSDRADDVTRRIAAHVASLIDDGATLQLGIGAIPDAVLRELEHHRGLGIHSEMISDGIIPLVEKGVITNEHKAIQRGKIVTSFVLGTRRIYDFVDNNKDVACMEASYVNDSAIIRLNPRVMAVNSAIEIDITGQVCADSIGSYQYSGIGGQVDFMSGAARSEGGKPIIAMPSTTRSGISRIVPFLKEGAGVVTTRGHIHYVVTEYGVVNLYGKNMEQRAKLLTSIAHPMHRESLERAANVRFGKYQNHE